MLGDAVTREKLYLLMWKQLDKIQKKENICRIQHTEDGLVRCRKMSCGKNLCCGGCPYLTDKGCSTICLGCKLWFCSAVLSDRDLVNEHASYFKLVRQIMKTADKYDIPLTVRTSMNELF